MEKFAIIDLGSNTVRLVIFEVYANGSFKLVEDISNTVRLREGMTNDMYLNPKSMERAKETMSLFSTYCQDYDIPKSNTYAVATEAVRKAKNGHEFLNEVKKECNFDCQILTGEEEALYVYNAVIRGFTFNHGIIIDIGGGSFEIIRFSDNKIIGFTSLPFGCVNTSENYLNFKNPPRSNDLNHLTKTIKDQLDTLPWLSDIQNERIIGLGGTIRNLCKIHKVYKKYPFSKAHNYFIPVDDVKEIFNSLSSMNLSELSNIEGLSNERRDVIVGGLTILNTLIEKTNSKKLVISGYGLREGVFFKHTQSRNILIPFHNALEFSLENLMRLYNVRQKHAYKSKEHALTLFDSLASKYDIDNEYRSYLEIAALLHDIGIAISFYSHQLHSLYLILNATIHGINHIDNLLIGMIASGLGPMQLKDYLSDRYIHLLSDKEYDIAAKLSVFIKLAHALDKSETGKIQSFEVLCHEDKIAINPICALDATIEKRAVLENKDLFRKTFGKDLVIN